MFTENQETLKIIDFGLAAYLTDGKCGDEGTRQYMAPE
jgi:serine/threonine protein kinase